MRKSIIVVAGGKGLRMGADLPKQFLVVAGRPVLMHTLEAFYRYDPQMQIVLVLPDDHRDYWVGLCAEYTFTIPHQIVSGGVTRFHSVRNGLSVVGDGLIGIHDGVRPLISRELIDRLYREAERSGASYPVVPMVDSMRLCHDDGSSEMVDRNRYCRVQTPQVFRSEMLLSAYEQPYSDIFTDDVSVVEHLGQYSPVRVEGELENIKITNRTDLLFAEVLLLNTPE